MRRIRRQQQAFVLPLELVETASPHVLVDVVAALVFAAHADAATIAVETHGAVTGVDGSKGESIRHAVPQVRSQLNRLTRFVLGEIHEDCGVEPERSCGRQQAAEATFVARDDY
jgi:hypothetical protein